MNKVLVFVKIMIIWTIICLVVCCAAIVIKLNFTPNKNIVHNNTELPDTPVVTEPTTNNSGASANDFTELIASNTSKIQGTVQWGLSVYDTDFRYATPAKPVPSASVIKVFIMEYLYDLMEQGKLQSDDRLGGSSVESLIYAMITQSDNSATNTFIDYAGMDKLNAFFEKQGYTDTRVERKMLDTKAVNEGKDNYTSIDDVMSFLDKLYLEKETYPYSEMLAIMKKQQVRTKIPRNFPGDVIIANKTGELSNVENDIGIVFTDKGDFAIAFLCSSLSDTAATRSIISDTSYEVYKRLINN